MEKIHSFYFSTQPAVFFQFPYLSIQDGETALPEFHRAGGYARARYHSVFMHS
jgi:hypothetical protein